MANRDQDLNEEDGKVGKLLRIRRKNKGPVTNVNCNSIQRCIQENDAKRLAKLLGQRAKLKLTDEDMALALMEAISQGKVECVPALLNARADPNCVDEDGKTPLIVCMESKAGGSPVIIKDLLKAGSSPNKASWTTQQTALHLAAKKGYQVAVKVLLNAAARTDKADSAGNTPLMYAAREGHFTALKMLLDCNCHPDPANKNGETPLLLAAKNGHLDCAEELVAYGADPDKRNNKGESALFLALKTSHMDMVQMLMSCECDVNIQNTQTGKTVMHWAVANGNIKLVQSLLRLGAEVNIRDKDWETPFITAILNKRLDIVKMLMESKCNMMITDKNFNTGLHLSAKEGLPQLLPNFLKAGLDCNLKNSTGQTPLMLAASGGHVETVSCLLKEGANPDATDRHRATALDYTLMSKASDDAVNQIIKILLNTGCQTEKGVTFHKFVKDSQLVTGPVLNKIEMRQYVPLEIAFLRGRPLAFLMLLKSGCSVQDINLDSIKHGQDWLSPKRMDFRTVLYLLKSVKTLKKQFPTLKQLCRQPAIKLFKNMYFSAHVRAVNPSPEIISYLQYAELDDLRNTFHKMVAASKGRTASANDDKDQDTEKSKNSSPFSRLSQLRSTYTLGLGHKKKSRLASESSEEGDTFNTELRVTRRPVSAGLAPQKTKHLTRARTNTFNSTDSNSRHSSNSSIEFNPGIESWVMNQNHSNSSTPRSVTPQRSKRGPRLNSPRTPTSMESMMFATAEPNNNDIDSVFLNQNSNDTGFQSEDTPRPHSPTEKNLQDLRSSALMWKSYTSPYNSLDDSVDSASINGSVGSRDTDISDPPTTTTGQKKKLTNGYDKAPSTQKRRVVPTANGMPSSATKTRIPVFKRTTPTPRKGRVTPTSHFVDVDDEGPSVFRRTKSCRNY